MLISMPDEVLEILTHPRVHNVEKVFPRWKSSNWHGIREVPHEGGILLETGPEIADRKLIVVWDIDSLDVTSFD